MRVSIIMINTMNMTIVIITVISIIIVVTIIVMTNDIIMGGISWRAAFVSRAGSPPAGGSRARKTERWA